MSQTVEAFITEFGEDYREELEERAGIMEFDEGLPKAMAEINAIRWMKKKYQLHTQAELFEEVETSTLARVARRLR